MQPFPSQSPMAAAGPATAAFIQSMMAKRGGPMPAPGPQGPPPSAIPAPPMVSGPPMPAAAMPGGPPTDEGMEEMSAGMPQNDPAMLAQLLGGGSPEAYEQEEGGSSLDEIIMQLLQQAEERGIPREQALAMIMQELEGGQAGPPEQSMPPMMPAGGTPYL